MDIKSIILAVTTIFISTCVNAVTVTYEGGQISGLSELETLGMSWNVSFMAGSENDVYPIPDYPFVPTDARTANESLLAALSALAPSAATDDFIGCTSVRYCYLTTPYLAHSGETVSGASVRYTYFSSPSLPDVQFQGDVDYDTHTFVVWEEVTNVPIPSAVWLFGSGLLGLIRVARRKAHV